VRYILGEMGCKANLEYRNTKIINPDQYL